MTCIQTVICLSRPFVAGRPERHGVRSCQLSTVPHHGDRKNIARIFGYVLWRRRSSAAAAIGVRPRYFFFRDRNEVSTAAVGINII